MVTVLECSPRTRLFAEKSQSNNFNKLCTDILAGWHWKKKRVEILKSGTLAFGGSFYFSFSFFLLQASERCEYFSFFFFFVTDGLLCAIASCILWYFPAHGRYCNGCWVICFLFHLFGSLGSMRLTG